MAEESRWLDATAQAALVHAGEATPAELVEAAIERIEAGNPALNAVVTETFDRAPRRRGVVRAARTGRSAACPSSSRTSGP